jgi:hypothetical protein
MYNEFLELLLIASTLANVLLLLVIVLDVDASDWINFK